MSKAKKAEAPRPYHYDILVSPVITEKSTMMAENKFMFNVRNDARKQDIRDAVERMFGVKVTKVNTLLRKGKTKRFRGIKGRQSDVKKALITLAEGQSIDLQSGVK